MIPKIIHYCWFGTAPLPQTDRHCIESWKKFFPDWEIRLWNVDNFTVNNDFLKRMSDEKKWGLYTEYVRFWALNTHGGIYLDTDIEVLKPFGSLLENDYFLGFETPGKVNIAVLGSAPGHPFNKEMLAYYDNFKYGDEIKWSVGISGPVLQKHIDITGKNSVVEFLPKSFIYPVDYFYPLPYESADEIDKMRFVTPDSYTIHYWNASWVDEWSLMWAGRYRTGWKMAWKRWKQKPFQPAGFYKNALFHLKSQIFGY